MCGFIRTPRAEDTALFSEGTFGGCLTNLSFLSGMSSNAVRLGLRPKASRGSRKTTPTAPGGMDVDGSASSASSMDESEAVGAVLLTGGIGDAALVVGGDVDVYGVSTTTGHDSVSAVTRSGGFLRGGASGDLDSTIISTNQAEALPNFSQPLPSPPTLVAWSSPWEPC